jgi:hypothetical protein
MLHSPSRPALSTLVRRVGLRDPLGQQSARNQLGRIQLVRLQRAIPSIDERPSDALSSGCSFSRELR